MPAALGEPSSRGLLRSDKGVMAFNSLVATPGRLQILVCLAGGGRQEFVAFCRSTRLTDGNLASHARWLELGRLITVDKQFRAGKPVTSFVLTPRGRAAPWSSTYAHSMMPLEPSPHRSSLPLLRAIPATNGSTDTSIPLVLLSINSQLPILQNRPVATR